MRRLLFCSLALPIVLMLCFSGLVRSEPYIDSAFIVPTEGHVFVIEERSEDGNNNAAYFDISVSLDDLRKLASNGGVVLTMDNSFLTWIYYDYDVPLEKVNILADSWLAMGLIDFSTGYFVLWKRKTMGTGFYWELDESYKLKDWKCYVLLNTGLKETVNEEVEEYSLQDIPKEVKQPARTEPPLFKLNGEIFKEAKVVYNAYSDYFLEVSVEQTLKIITGQKKLTLCYHPVKSPPNTLREYWRWRNK